MRPILAFSLALLLPGLAMAQSRTQGQAVTPRSSGVAECDEAAAAWRACIAASPKSPEDRAQAMTEVDKFIRDVFDSRDGGRRSLASACPATATGYRTMLDNGTCAQDLTGARDDAPRRGTRR
jgi:hypothetical protein